MDGGVEEIADFGEVDDFVELGIDFLFREAQHGGVDVDVLPPGQDGVEARSEGNERADPAAHRDLARVGLDQPVEHLEQSGFPCAVPADQSKAFAAAKLEADVLDRPEFLVAQLAVSAVPAAKQLVAHVLEPIPERLLEAQAELLRNPFDLDQGLVVARGRGWFVVQWVALCWGNVFAVSLVGETYQRIPLPVQRLLAFVAPLLRKRAHPWVADHTVGRHRWICPNHGTSRKPVGRGRRTRRDRAGKRRRARRSRPAWNLGKSK